MDSTAQYGYGEMHDGTVSSSAEALADDNPWNTYVHAGLPIGPISNPGDVAIDARDASGRRRLAVLRHGEPRHRRDRLHDQPRRSPSRRRAVAGVVRRSPGLGVLTPQRVAPRGLGRPDRAQPVAAAARRRVPRARPRLVVRTAPRRRSGVPGRRSLGSTTRGADCRSRCRSRRPPSTRRAQRDRRAELTGAVNTLLLDPDGPRGFNTDVGGIVARSRRRGRRPRSTARASSARAPRRPPRSSHCPSSAHGEVEVVARRPEAVAALAELGERLGIAVTAASVRRPTRTRPCPSRSRRSPATRRCRMPRPTPSPRRGGLLLDVVYGHWPTCSRSAWERAGHRPRRDSGCCCTRLCCRSGSSPAATPRCSPG